jgi:hypothetical protein
MNEENQKRDSINSTPMDPIQNMVYSVFKMHQDYCKQQQQATIQYWTDIIRATYNPWK